MFFRSRELSCCIKCCRVARRTRLTARPDFINIINSKVCQSNNQAITGLQEPTSNPSLHPLDFNGKRTLTEPQHRHDHQEAFRLRKPSSLDHAFCSCSLFLTASLLYILGCPGPVTHHTSSHTLDNSL